MKDDAIRDIQARIDAQEIVMEILCAQLWAQLSPQKMELIGQRYMRMLHESLASEVGGDKRAATQKFGEKILKNAMIRASSLRSTL